MTCRVCGGELRERTTDLPFKIGDHSLVIVKDLPVLQRTQCQEYVLPDEVMARVEQLLGPADTNTELEIVRYAA